ncbi:MAG: glycosyltransferase family 2 protein [Candidatus Fermentibacter sp.]|nr:glycosyltransferase family 2 protein [Candidatus Fermentibacter sp.]
MSTRAPVTVIVPNYEGRDLLSRCLPSILSQEPAPAEVLVVDNGSTDGSPGMVVRDFPSVRLIALDSNLGFARANNIAAAEASNPLLALVNNDCVAAPGWLEALVGAAGGPGDGVGAVTSSMRNSRDPGLIDSAGGETDHMGFARDRGAGRPASEFASRTEVPFPCAGACLVRRDALEDGKTLFWERLVFYMEDVDLGFRLHAGGWRVLYEPDAVIAHEHSATGSRNPLGKEINCVRNRLLVLRRHLPAGLFRSMLPLMLAYQAVWALSAALALRGRQLRALAEGTAMGLSWRVEGMRQPSGHLLLSRFATPPGGGRVKRAAQGMAERLLEDYCRRA